MSPLRPVPTLSAPVDFEARWALGERPVPGGPLFMRVNLAVEPLAGRPGYGDWLMIVSRYRDADELGLPALEELEDLAGLEDALTDVLGADRLCVLAVVATHPGERKLLFYTRDPEAAARRLSELAARLPRHDLRYGFGADPAWSVYRGFKRTLP